MYTLFKILFYFYMFPKLLALYPQEWWIFYCSLNPASTVPQSFLTRTSVSQMTPARHSTRRTNTLVFTEIKRFKVIANDRAPVSS